MYSHALPPACTPFPPSAGILLLSFFPGPFSKPAKQRGWVESRRQFNFIFQCEDQLRVTPRTIFSRTNYIVSQWRCFSPNRQLISTSFACISSWCLCRWPGKLLLLSLSETISLSFPVSLHAHLGTRDFRQLSWLRKARGRWDYGDLSRQSGRLCQTVVMNLSCLGWQGNGGDHIISDGEIFIELWKKHSEKIREAVTDLRSSWSSLHFIALLCEGSKFLTLSQWQLIGLNVKEGRKQRQLLVESHTMKMRHWTYRGWAAPNCNCRWTEAERALRASL